MIVFVYFFILLYIFNRINKEKTIRRWVYGLYCFSSFCSVLYYLFIPIKYEQSIIAHIYYILCTLLLLYPIWYIGNKDCNDFELPERFIKASSYLLIFFGFISLYYTIPQLFTLKTYLNNLSEIRSAYYHQDNIFETSNSFISILANWVSYIQFLSPFYCILNIVKRNYKIAVLLFIVSFVPALNNMLIGEREASVVVLSNFVFSYIFFFRDFTPKIIKRIKIIGALFLSILVIFIIYMTYSRFNESGIGKSLLVYIGEQPFNFSYFFSNINIQEQYLGGRYTFGYLFPESQRLDGQLNEFINANEYLNVFAGIPGSFLLDFSYAAIFIILLFSRFFCSFFKEKNRKKNGKYGFSICLAYIIYYQIIFMGLFYFDFNRKYTIIMCILVFLAYVITKYFFKWSTKR